METAPPSIGRFGGGIRPFIKLKVNLDIKCSPLLLRVLCKFYSWPALEGTPEEGEEGRRDNLLHVPRGKGGEEGELPLRLPVVCTVVPLSLCSLASLFPSCPFSSLLL